MNQVVRDFLHVLAGATTMVIGIAFVAILQLFLSLFSGLTASGEAPVPILRPLESVNAPKAVLELSCYDLHILPVWHELKKDDQFKERVRFSTGLLNCSEMLKVRRHDLNRDGTDEILVRGKGPVLCSASRSCGYWMFAVVNGQARMLLSASDDAVNEFGAEVQTSRTRGYADLILTEHHAAAETKFRTYLFDGIRYTESRCIYEIPKQQRDGEGSWQLVTCEQYDREGY